MAERMREKVSLSVRCVATDRRELFRLWPIRRLGVRVSQTCLKFRKRSLMDSNEKAQLFCQDVMGYYGHSLDRIHTQSTADREEIQIDALKLRFQQLRDAIPMLKKMADGDGIESIEELNDVVPLLFDHTMYKSYPPSLLHNNRFDKLTQWLNKLTAIDLSDFDASDCHGVDDWMTALFERTPMSIQHTSGTSGVFSFLPKTKEGYRKFIDQYRLSILQKFGENTPLQEFPLNLDVIYPYFRSGNGHLRLNELYVEYIAGGEERFHALYPGRLNSDVLLLSSRIRVASTKGELDRLEVRPELLAMREEFMELETNKEAYLARFFQHLGQELGGKKIFMQATPGMLYQTAEAGLARGDRGLFAPDSIIVAGGGAKGVSLPLDWVGIVKEFTGADHVIQIYGMSELLTFNPICENGHYHILPGTIPFILDPETSQPLPRTGTVTGRWAHFDLVPDTWWGGFISGDEVTMHWDDECPCGRKTPYLEKNIQRLSEKRGGDDKITCAATQETYQEAMDFLIKVER